ncbi:carbohydrate sulfotransferase 5-like [Bombina bombina]|uniref:carbohydrate sulfotransferase 5-like n=1 Tax=Bombina bombina TaxID=8345 RepID=UPI00235ADC2C|nr:carbohydrate sulfotransferase 5-like [Bombina bombina]
MKMKNEKSEFLHYPVRDLLHSLFTCDVSPLLYYLPLGRKQVSELKFFAESRALCVPPACKASIPLEGYDRVMCSYRCRTSPIEVMAETCRTHSHIAMKTVRIFDLQVLLPLFRDPLMDLRIVHMVRDPRAVISSRKSFELDVDDNIVLRKEMEEKNITPNLVHVMGKICKAQVAIHKFARSANSSLRGRYMMIRHEELAWGPIQRAKKLYSFSGLNMTSELESFVYNITHVNKQDTGTFMSFSRKSPEVVSRWRKRLNYSTVMEIQNVCQEAMEVFGYIPVWSMRDLRDVSFNIVAEREALEDE